MNNDDAVFVPKLKIKHNSLPLTASNLRVIDEDTEILGIYDQDSFGHPYQFEISHLKVIFKFHLISSFSNKRFFSFDFCHFFI